MDSGGKKDCKWEGRDYSHGTEVCDSERCMRCNDGDWEDRFQDLIYGFGP